MPTTFSGMKISSKPIDSIPTAQSRSTAGSVPRSSVGYVAPNLRPLVPMSAAILATRVIGCEPRRRECDAQRIGDGRLPLDLFGRDYLHRATSFWLGVATDRPASGATRRLPAPTTPA